MTAAPKPRAACAGNAPLFEAEDVASHRKARAICNGCPVREACGRLLEDTIKAYGYDAHTGPRGTWAGKLLNAGQPKTKRAAA